MPDYLFHTLSPLDFEFLVRDLLQIHLSIQLETFKTGKDNGIDLRYAKANGRSLIVQAKHYRESGYKGLFSHLKNEEKPKIARLAPDEYMLATSVPLNPRQKGEILSELSPFIRSTASIYGKDDLNNLLGQFPRIERQHFKLWLSSSSVLDEILHSKVYRQSAIDIQEIENSARVYVSNQSFNSALDILAESDYAIISGIPGIGKTTLARMLVLHFVRNGYEFVTVSEDISEAYSIPDHHSPIVYLYDDFLGRTSLDIKLGKNEDHRLHSFIRAIRGKHTAKLIMTTREYILQQAKQKYELIADPIFDRRYIISLAEYTRQIRAAILYNHLYFSQLPIKYIESIVLSPGHLKKIIDHRNYNPRIIAYMTNPEFTGTESTKALRYPEEFLQNLEHPSRIWEQAFNNHLDDNGRAILLVLSTLPSVVFLPDLLTASKEYCLAKSCSITEHDFKRCLKALEGTFIALQKDMDNVVVSYHSPSVQDFIEAFIGENKDCKVSLFKGAYYFEQIRRICDRYLEHDLDTSIRLIMATKFASTWRNKPCQLNNYLITGNNRTYKAYAPLYLANRLAYVAHFMQKWPCLEMQDAFRKALSQYIAEMHSLGNAETDGMLALSEGIAGLRCVDDLRDIYLIAVKEALYADINWISDVKRIIEFKGSNPHLYTLDDNQRIVETIAEVVGEHVVNGDRDYEFLQGELVDLEIIEKECRLGLKGEIESLRHCAEEAEAAQTVERDCDDDRYYGSSEGGTIGDEDIFDMFSTLLDRD